MQLDPQYIIKSCDNYAKQHFRDDDDTGRLAYQVGMLQAKIIELCTYLDNAQDEIKELQNEIIQLKAHL